MQRELPIGSPDKIDSINDSSKDEKKTTEDPPGKIILSGSSMFHKMSSHRQPQKQICNPNTAAWEQIKLFQKQLCKTTNLPQSTSSLS